MINMYEVSVRGDFSSSHHLRDYDGKCENVHGHNWNVEVVYMSEKLNNVGLVIDFKILKEKLNEVLDTLDHTDLNAIQYFQKFNPSSENIAYYIFMQLSKIPDLYNKAQLKCVRVWETEGSCATYYE